MPNIAEKVAAFRALHKKGDPVIMANAWDAGSARILEGLGFKATATTSSGFALTMGRKDYGVTREETLQHSRLVSSAVDIPVSADLENGFGPSPADAAKTIRAAAETGLAGGSIEDSTGDKDAPIFDKALAVDRVAAAVEAAKAAKHGFVLTARAEAFLWGVGALKEVIARLQAYEDAGADVLFAPGLPDLGAVKAVCSSVGKPVNILPMGGLAGSSPEDLAKAGAARISIGGSLAFSVYGTLVEKGEAILRDRNFASIGATAGARRLKSWLA